MLLFRQYQTRYWNTGRNAVTQVNAAAAALRCLHEHKSQSKKINIFIVTLVLEIFIFHALTLLGSSFYSHVINFCTLFISAGDYSYLLDFIQFISVQKIRKKTKLSKLLLILSLQITHAFDMSNCILFEQFFFFGRYYRLQLLYTPAYFRFIGF